MCGFAGILNRSEGMDLQPILERMSAIIQHRGPDDSGLEVMTRRAGMSFRRLSIVDLSVSGRQPMKTADGMLCIAFNGEIYNAEDLRAKRVPDYPYRSRTDTEVILALYEKHGLDAIAMLNGMFSIALWDGRARKLHLCSDRLGIKPLYYAFTHSGLVFASEIKSLFQHPDVPRGICPAAVNEYLSFQFTLGSKTLLKDVHHLEPGTIASFDEASPDRAASMIRYWDFDYRPEEDRSLDDFSAELRAELVDSIRRQTRSDVPIGSYLSSGMDTGSIAALAVELVPGLNTFTCGFNTTELDGSAALHDERADARELSRKLRTTHHEISLDHDAAPALFAPVIRHMEDPKVGISYQIYAMAEHVRKHVTVVLSGTGGDELFAGYPWRYEKILGLRDHAAFCESYYSLWTRILSDEDRRRFIHPERAAEIDFGAPKAEVAAILEHARGWDPLAKALYFDAKTFLRGLLLVEDKLSMAHSIETRVPLLDNRILDLAARIPSRYKMADGDTKIVLKRAVKGIIPDEVLTRRKQGFTPPDDIWFRHQNRAWIESRLLSQEFLDRKWISRRGIETILDRHFSGRQPCRFTLWSLLCLDGVYREFIG